MKSIISSISDHSPIMAFLDKRPLRDTAPLYRSSSILLLDIRLEIPLVEVATFSSGSSK